MKTLILTLISVSLVNNVVLSQFLGLCPFLGVSKQTKTALSMGVQLFLLLRLLLQLLTFYIVYLFYYM